MVTPTPRFALFTNGSAFSLAVLHELLSQQIAPELIVLPVYPPSFSDSNPAWGNVAPRVDHPVQALAGSIPIAYAPREKQAEIIETLSQHKIELLLVACWPYLIKPAVIAAIPGPAINLHPSKLPLFRGPDPIGTQLEAGHRPFAVSLHHLNNSFDEGDLIAQQDIQMAAINADPAALTRATIERACAATGVKLFLELAQQDPQDWARTPQHL